MRGECHKTVLLCIYLVKLGVIVSEAACSAGLGVPREVVGLGVAVHSQGMAQCSGGADHLYFF